MELLSPAGNVEKLYYAYAYGADAAYIGLKKFSLRVKADNFYEDEYKKVIALKEQFGLYIRIKYFKSFSVASAGRGRSPAEFSTGSYSDGREGNSS